MFRFVSLSITHPRTLISSYIFRFQYHQYAKMICISMSQWYSLWIDLTFIVALVARNVSIRTLEFWNSRYSSIESIWIPVRSHFHPIPEFSFQSPSDVVSKWISREVSWSSIVPSSHRQHKRLQRAQAQEVSLFSNLFVSDFVYCSFFYDSSVLTIR